MALAWFRMKVAPRFRDPVHESSLPGITRPESLASERRKITAKLRSTARIGFLPPREPTLRRRIAFISPFLQLETSRLRAPKTEDTAALRLTGRRLFLTPWNTTFL
jgi:hypothetical protein